MSSNDSNNGLIFSSAAKRAADFLSRASQFALGELPTEKQNPLTANLAELAQSDHLIEAIEVFRLAELTSFDKAFSERERIVELWQAVQSCFARGHRVYLCGCGATGRLSLGIETLFRESRVGDDSADSVRSFMAGGDYALVRSIENFEDHPEYGARQLRDSGFTSGDLLIAITEGGETPFVIGAVEEASRIGNVSPWFLFCNETDILRSQVERSRRVIENANINSFCLPTGPMAIAGSTRLQASSVLMLAAGAAVLSNDRASLQTVIDDYRAFIASADLTILARLIRAEAATYAANQRCLHATDVYGLTVLTDTTERSPTFSLVPFENLNEPNAPASLTYLHIIGAPSGASAWQTILHRPTRGLQWGLAGSASHEDKANDEVNWSVRYGATAIDGFDFGQGAIDRRQHELHSQKRFLYQIRRAVTSAIHIDFRDHACTFKINSPSLLVEHLAVKLIMNTASTLVMCRLGKVIGNLMIDVKPSNSKLIDRSIRIARLAMRQRGLKVLSYEETCLKLFEVLETLPLGQAAVPTLLKKIETEIT